jgi:DNA-binding MarR family transcriptional regulator
MIEYASNDTAQNMSSQVLTDQAGGVRTFVALVQAHAGATRLLNAQLVADHGLTINDYEVLLRLSRAPDRRMRRVDLAGEVLLTASGITRLLDGLERAGLVERAACASDRRVVYAVITEAGLFKLKAASATHVPQVEGLFTSRLDPEQLDALAALLEQLGGESDELSCEPDVG